MGTLVTIEVVRPGPDAEAAIGRAFGWFHEIEARCTRFDPRSELMQLTAHAGQPVSASVILFEAVRFALMLAEESGGAFDPTVGHRMEARGFNREHRTGEIVRTAIVAADDVTYGDVELDPDRRTITLRRPLTLDLGAVAKGLAVDAAARELEHFQDFAIDAGGDLYLGGSNAQGAPWCVGVRHPRRDGEVIDSLLVSNQAVCTSGDYERRVFEELAQNGARREAVSGPSGGARRTLCAFEELAQNGVRREAVSGPPGGSRRTLCASNEHHILDPRVTSNRLGCSPGAVASATVVASGAMLADGLATAAFVLGPEAGIQLLNRLGVDGLIVTPDLERFETGGLRYGF